MPALTFVCSVSKYILECTFRFPGIETDRRVSTKTYSSHMPGLRELGLVEPFTELCTMYFHGVLPEGLLCYTSAIPPKVQWGHTVKKMD